MAHKNATERLVPDRKGIARAAEILRDGGLVAVPTETVYGLAARADSGEAVARIYAAKGRPDFNPLIVHIANLEQAKRLARFDDRALELAAQFWPGPLTLVLPLSGNAPLAAAVTAGLPNVALRMPAHPAMRALLEQAQVPLAAPSANRSGSISPSRADHVAMSLDGRIDAILDGGPCGYGMESTIVAVRDGNWQVLRPGHVTEEQLTEFLGQPEEAAPSRVEAPGQLASHYSPGKPVRLEAEEAATDEFMIGFGDIAGDCSLSESGDLAQAAARLYQCLHEAARSERPRIAVAPIPPEGIGRAINDRLCRAAA